MCYCLAWFWARCVHLRVKGKVTWETLEWLFLQMKTLRPVEMSINYWPVQKGGTFQKASICNFNFVPAATDQSVYRAGAGWTVRGSSSGNGKGFSLHQNRPYPLRGPRSLLFNENQGPLPRVKRQEHGVYLYPSNVEAKNEWSYSSPPSLHFHVLDRSALLLTFKFVGRNIIRIWYFAGVKHKSDECRYTARCHSVWRKGTPGHKSRRKIVEESEIPGGGQA